MRPARKPSSNTKLIRGNPARDLHEKPTSSGLRTKTAKSDRSATSVSDSITVLPGWNAPSDQTVVATEGSSCRESSRAVANPSTELDRKIVGLLMRYLS